MVQKVLNQEQIDAMVRAARGGAVAESSSEKKVIPWDARQAGQIGREQMRAIDLLHESFARSLTDSVSAYLRIAFTAALVSAEHLTFGEFLQRLPEVTYLASCRLKPVGETALLQLDLAVAFPLIDVLLGGEGKGTPPSREITEIEEQVIETIVRIICRELQVAWQALSLEFSFEQRQKPEQVTHLMSGEEKTLSLSFEITVADSRGTLNLMVPAVVSNALLRQTSAGQISLRRRGRTHSDERLKQRLLDCPFLVELGMNAVPVSLGDLTQLSPGGLLVFDKPAADPATVLIGGQKAFSAVVARKEERRAAKLLDHVVEKEPERKRKR